MSLPRYPEYKESGVGWLGEVPGHWEVLPCRAFVDEQTAKNDDGKNEDYLSLMANVGIIPYADKGDVGNKKPEDLTKCKLVSKGDFVINSMNYGIGSYGLSALDGICSPVYIVLRPRLDRIESRYAFRIFENRAFQTFAQSFGNGILEHRAAINWDILKSIGVGIPPKDEQVAILNFLDRETGKIDALIAEQQRLVELLAEKRQAVISHAVTKGLNPNAKMKDSGIEWLGDVPEHWDVLSIRRIATSVQTGGTPSSQPPSLDLDEGFVWYTPGDFGVSIFLGDSSRKITHAVAVSGEANIFPAGSVLIVSIGATLGKVGYIDKPSSANQQINAIVPSEKVDGYFLAYSLLVKGEVMRFLSNASTIGIMNQEKTKEIWLSVPPRAEQQTISTFLDTETAKFDTLTAEANLAIALLQERRSALISAAVTGKIDVRQLAKKEAV